VRSSECPLLWVKRTLLRGGWTSAFSQKRTLGTQLEQLFKFDRKFVECGQTRIPVPSRRWAWVGLRHLHALLLDQLDPIAIGVLDEGDNAIAVPHRARLSANQNAFLCEPFAGGVNVGHANAQITEPLA